MTLEQFFKALPQKGWKISDGRFIRSGKVCPITKVCHLHTGLQFRPNAFRLAAEALGLRKSTANKLATASDGNGESRLRQRLLKHCGLKEIPRKSVVGVPLQDWMDSENEGD